MLQQTLQIVSWQNYLHALCIPAKFGNQLSRHYRYCYNPPSAPPPPCRGRNVFATPSEDPFNKSVILSTEPLPGQLQQNCSYRKSHLYVRFGSIKEISSQFAEKRTGKILIILLLKTEIFASWNSKKSGRPDFWRFWESKVGTVLIKSIKSGQLAGMLVTELVLVMLMFLRVVSLFSDFSSVIWEHGLLWLL